jgi:hypothetical protein
MQAGTAAVPAAAAATAAGTAVDSCHLHWMEARALAGLVVMLAAEFSAFYLLVAMLRPFWRAALLAMAVAELVFFLVWLKKRAHLDAIPYRHEPEDHDAWVHFQRWRASFHYNSKVLSIAELIKYWFEDVPLSSIKRGNAAELVGRGYFYKPL